MYLLALYELRLSLGWDNSSSPVEPLSSCSFLITCGPVSTWPWGPRATQNFLGLLLHSETTHPQKDRDVRVQIQGLPRSLSAPFPFSVGGGTCRHLCRDWLHGRVKSPWAPEALGRPLSGSHFFWVQQHPHTLLPMLLGCPIHMGGIKDSLMLALSSRGRRKTVLLWGTAGLEQRRGVGADSKSCLSKAAPAARCGRDLRSRCPGNRRDGHLPGQPPIFV